MSDSKSRERVRIWWNPRAGRGQAQELADRTRAEAIARGHEADLLPTDRAGATDSLADEIAAGAIDRLIVIGGDGTIHHAVQAAAQTSVVVGIVSAGSGNDLVRAVGLDTTSDAGSTAATDAGPAAAIERALGPAAPVDLLRIGERYGITVATLGFSVAVNRRAEGMGWPRGASKYTVATVLELVDLHRYPLTIHLDGRRPDGERLDVAPNLVAVANTSIFGGGMAIAPDARPDDGLLDLVLVGPASRTQMLRVLPGVRSGRHIDHPAVEVHRVTRVTIESAEPYQVWADGEAVGSTPTGIEVVPGALRLAGWGRGGAGRDT